MSEKQLADFTTQQLREKQSTSAEQGAILRTSTQEVLEARQRNTMAGQQETWRGGSGAGSTGLDGDDSHEESSKRRRVEESQSEESRSVEIEKKALSEGKQGAKAVTNKPSTPVSNKRPIDVDAGTRMISNPSSPSSSSFAQRPAKLKKLEMTESSESSPSGAAKGEDPQSPRNKAPSVLELLRNKSAPSPTSHSRSTEPLPVVAPVKALQNNQMAELESSVGAHGFVITRPGGVFIECKAYSTNRFIPNICLKILHVK